MSAMNAYRRDLALVALQSTGKEMTSAEVQALMQEIARAENHPRACWQGITAQQAAGHMRTLEAAGSARKGEPIPNPRVGSPTPTWVATHIPDRAPPLPDPPSAEGDVGAAAPPLAQIEVDGLSVPQLRVLLRVSDDGFGLLARQMRELQDFTARARDQLQRAGIAL